jgi:hypothetical protein
MCSARYRPVPMEPLPLPKPNGVGRGLDISAKTGRAIERRPFFLLSSWLFSLSSWLSFFGVCLWAQQGLSARPCTLRGHRWRWLFSLGSGGFFFRWPRMGRSGGVPLGTAGAFRSPLHLSGASLALAFFAWQRWLLFSLAAHGREQGVCPQAHPQKASCQAKKSHRAPPFWLSKAI